MEMGFPQKMNNINELAAQLPSLASYYNSIHTSNIATCIIVSVLNGSVNTSNLLHRLFASYIFLVKGPSNRTAIA